MTRRWMTVLMVLLALAMLGTTGCVKKGPKKGGPGTELGSDRVIVDQGAYPLETFYPQYFSYGALDEPSWRALFLESYSSGTFLPMAEARVGQAAFRALAYVRSYPNVDAGPPTFVIWALVAESDLQRLLPEMPVMR